MKPSFAQTDEVVFIAVYPRLNSSVSYPAFFRGLCLSLYVLDVCCPLVSSYCRNLGCCPPLSHTASLLAISLAASPLTHTASMLAFSCIAVFFTAVSLLSNFFSRSHSYLSLFSCCRSYRYFFPLNTMSRCLTSIFFLSLDFTFSFSLHVLSFLSISYRCLFGLLFSRSLFSIGFSSNVSRCFDSLYRCLQSHLLNPLIDRILGAHLLVLSAILSSTSFLLSQHLLLPTC
jgi:hypothetical protein